MPELPEVETTKEGIRPHLEGYIIEKVLVRNSKLRLPVPADIDKLCANKKILAVSRRAKYLIIQLSQGYIVVHLGMSGHLRITSATNKPEKHDHIDINLNSGVILRYRDPRRFGLFIFLENNPYMHALFGHLGPEPLSKQFSAQYLFQKSRNKNQPIKSLIMNNEIVVGVGNIYATESLFFAGIHPATPAKKLTLKACLRLILEIKKILRLAIKAGGTTLQDFYTHNGKPGYFTLFLKVYGRKKQACLVCKQTIEVVIIGGRASAFCPQCQIILD